MKVRTLNIAGMPKRDAEALQWLQNFAHGLASCPDLWAAMGVTRDTSERVAALVKAFDEALTIASAPGSSASHVLAKTMARNNAVLAVRAAVNSAKANPAIGSVHLGRLNLPTIRDELERQRIEARLASHQRRAV